MTQPNDHNPSNTLTFTERAQLMAKAGLVFTPSAPITSDKFFAGRIKQLRQITETIGARGRHAIMYGDRGVGKTSLASILKPLYSKQPGFTFAKVNCNDKDTFVKVWRRILDDVRIVEENVAESGAPNNSERRLSDYVDIKETGPGEIRQVIQYASQEDWQMMLVFDEFNELPEVERNLFASLIKDLSDNSVSTTLVLVGVARDVLSLVKEHASIDRCMTQILMPRMTPEELYEVLSRAMNALDMRMSEDAQQIIVFLSQGIPHVTHLLGQESTYRAIAESRREITLKDVVLGISDALEKTQQSVRNSYHIATRGQRSGTLYPQVLLACALAETDELGFFGSADVRGPLCEITQKDYDIPNFSQHLDKLSSDPSRGPVLEKVGSTRRFKFRFRDPLLQPFVIMKGLQEGVVTGELRALLEEKLPGVDPNDPKLFH